MNKKRLMLSIVLVAAMLLPAFSSALATGGGGDADADAYAYAVVKDIEILTSGLIEEGKTINVTYKVTFDTWAYAEGNAQSGWAFYTEAGAQTSTYADGWAWGSVTAPDGTVVSWFDTGIQSNSDSDSDHESNWFWWSDANAWSYSENTETWIVTTAVNLNQLGTWEAYMGADTLASAFAQAGYKMCYLWWCFGDKEFDDAFAYDFAELIRRFRVKRAPQLPSLKLWLHTEGTAMEVYRGTHLINPWTVKSLSVKPIEWIVPYMPTPDRPEGMGAWFDGVQRGAYMIQPWDPANGHAAELFGIVVYQSKVTGVEVHLWPYPDDGHPLVQNRGSLIFATRPAAEMIQARYEALGRNPSEEELVGVVTGAVNMHQETLEAYLAVAVN